MKQIVFSTHNENKLNEIKKILSDNFKILGLIDLNFNDEIIESGKTLAQNADIKASYINKLYNIDCFADDTGLEIDSLNGEPGVYSARYAGDECNSEKNIEKVLNRLSNKKCRKAVFKTVICLVSAMKNIFLKERYMVPFHQKEWVNKVLDMTQYLFRMDLIKLFHRCLWTKKIKLVTER